MMEDISEKNKKEWENIEDEEERMKRKELQEMKRNVWTWRGKNQIFKADPRENLSLNKKLNILENMLENEKNEKEERLKNVEENKKVWKTVREEKAIMKKDLIEKKRRQEKSWRR